MTALVRLLNDAGVAGTWTPFGTGTLANSQCTLDLATSSATPAGTNLSLALRLTFSASFVGTKSIFMRANSNFGSATTGWFTRGTWDAGALVQAISVTPNSSTNTIETFALAYSDGEGVTTDLASARVRFRGATGPQCLIDYNAMTDRGRIQSDAGEWLPAVPFGSGTLANTYCLLDLTRSSAAPDGTHLTLTLSLTFYPSFAGTKNIDMRATSNSGATTGWVNRGSWNAISTWISFDALSGDGQPFTSHSESDFTVSATEGSWLVSTTYGHPAPFIRFNRLADEDTVSAQISITAAGSTFWFHSVDLYSSITPIPYVFTGLLNGATVFTASGTVPGTHGDFATVASASGAAIDTLLIQLSNPAMPGFLNLCWARQHRRAQLRGCSGEHLPAARASEGAEIDHPAVLS